MNIFNRDAGQGYRSLVIWCLGLFLLALGLRMGYQVSSEVSIPLRADSGKYMSAAFNLQFHGAHSLDAPSLEHSPQSRTDLAPGYPLFLTLFVDRDTNPEAMLSRVLWTQALLGAGTVVLTLLLAHIALPFGWSVAAALLTAFSPHLIALEQLLLTETLFTFMLLAGVLFCTLGWRQRDYRLVLAGALILAFSGQVRTIGWFLPLFLAPFYLLRPDRERPAYRRQGIRLGAMPLLAFGLVWVAHWGFEQQAVLNGPQAEQPQPKYVHFQSPLAYLKDTLTPPRFLTANESHIRALNHDPDWKHRSHTPFSEAPWRYIQWNLWGRWFWMWHFDNAYNGDVNIYPMERSGFVVNPVLGGIHGAMRALHWPLYLLSLVGLVALVALWYKGRLGNEAKGLLIPAATFFYFLTALSIVTWLPRYTIPLRPLSYVLAAAALWGLYTWIKGGFKTPKKSAAHSRS